MSLLVSMLLLHVSSREVVIRQYTLTLIFKLFNCGLYELMYYIITITSVSASVHVNTFNISSGLRSLLNMLKLE
jgi:hypothetical protein